MGAVMQKTALSNGASNWGMLREISGTGAVRMVRRVRVLARTLAMDSVTKSHRSSAKEFLCRDEL